MATMRRLSAILVADVMGYSRLMGLDEEGTHERCTSHLRELFAPKIKQHHGRVVKSTGDGVLAEFRSVVNAVRCAVEVQYGMRGRNSAVADDRQIAFRIGINVGDVIAVPGDIFGDGVNVAARLEPLAEPNGICISHAVHEQIQDKLPYSFEDLGFREVKNIARPLHVFALRAAAIAALPAPDGPVVATLVGSSSLALARPPAPRLSIIVLPFKNLNDDRDQQYLADAITDDVTTDLSRIADMAVISRNTAFTYRDKPIDTRQIGRDLQVRYVLEGSVRRSGNRIRVNTQLIDAETDAHVWADRTDYASDNLLELQDEVTGRIAAASNLKLIGAEAARSNDHPDALDYVFRGRAALNKGSTRENLAGAIQMFETALQLDGQSLDARIFLVHALVARALEQLSGAAADDLARAEHLLAEVTGSSHRQSLVHFWKAQLLRARGRYNAAIPDYEACLALDRNSILALTALGQCRFFLGDVENVIPAQLRAIRLSPADPYLPNWYWRIGMVHLLQSRLEEAIAWLERASSVNPRLPGPHGWLVSAYALSGDLARAAAELGEARRLSGDDRYASIGAHKAAQPFEAAKLLILAEDTFFAGLRKAGLPE
jgi:adenylate cyclase